MTSGPTVASVPNNQVPLPPSAEGGDALKFFGHLMRRAVKQGASDIHLRVKNHPLIRIDGILHRLREYPVLSNSDMEQISQKLMSQKHWELFKKNYQVDVSLGISSIGRCRVNVFYQRGTIAMALRVIQSKIPTPEELKLPPQVRELTRYERGLVLLTGATGSGKSTTIASLINDINLNYAKHVVTIEDPIEYIFSEQRCIISQRELRIDAISFPMAMAAALREDPDVILLGEMREAETIETALTAAETGHLVFSTLHAPAAAETVTRMISSFAPEAQPTIRSKLAQNLRAVIAQRLLPHASGIGRVVACEILTVNARVRELILDPLRGKEINDLIRKESTVEGMLSFDQHLFELTRRNEITEEVALLHASSPTDLKLKLEGF
ncbi:type IV pilus twitching motility protein PilT [Pseudomonadota bacterium]